MIAQQEVVACACGCGNTRPRLGPRGEPRRFILGHARKNLQTKKQWPRYKWIRMPDHPRARKDGMVMEHIVICEKAIGRFIPEIHEIHHFNEDRLDNSPQNLVICENAAYHRLLHRRQAIVAAGGNPGTDKICTVCGKAKPRVAFCLTNPQSRHGKCLACRRDIHKRLRELGRTK